MIAPFAIDAAALQVGDRLGDVIAVERNVGHSEWLLLILRGMHPCTRRIMAKPRRSWSPIGDPSCHSDGYRGGVSRKRLPFRFSSHKSLWSLRDTGRPRTVNPSATRALYG